MKEQVKIHGKTRRNLRKGQHIGRKKTRPSEMIRELLRSGMSHRKISAALRISHGSVSLEKSIMRKEQAVLQEAERVKELAVNQKELQVLDESTPW